MRIELRVSGGIAAFPGLSRPVTLDTANLPADEAAKAEQLVAAAHFFTLPQAVAPTPGAADYRTYTLTVEDAGTRHTIARTDPLQDPNLAALIQYVQSAGKRG